MPSENRAFRTARERTESAGHPGECLSRQELAELVNRHIWQHRQERVELAGNYIGKLERGVIRWPGSLYREAFRAVLGASSDDQLGFCNPRRSVVKIADVDRQQFLRAAALGVSGLAFASVSDWLEGSEPTTTPNRIGATEIEQIRTAAQVFAGWDHTYGGGLAREAVLAQLRWSATLLDASYPANLRGRLHSAVGYLAHTCAFMAFDAYAHQDARRVFRFALACAEEAGDWHLRAKILSSMARQAIWTGSPDDGVTLAEQALVRSDRLTRTEQAMLHTARARALAKMHRTRETLIAVGTADEHFARRRPGDDPQWMAYYDPAQHAGDTGHALFDLALHGRFAGEASARLASAVNGHDATFARSRAISQIKLATLTMTTGDPMEAAAIGRAALAAADTIRSRRAADDLRELRRHALREEKHAEVAALRDQIGTAVVST